MAKPPNRSYSRYASEATKLLGLMIHNARLEQSLSIADVAERAGVSRGLVQRVEKGEMGSSIGVAFEIATIVGLPLFEADATFLTRQLSMEKNKQALLPKSAHKSTIKVKDDF